MNNYLFVHIPKTAGTSFRISYEKAVGTDKLFYDYGPHAVETRLTTFEFLYNENEAHIEQLRLKLNDIENSLIFGHFKAAKYADFFNNGQICTILRDPIKRAYSDFLHFRRHLGFKGSLEDFCKIPSFRNRQSFFLEKIDLESIGFIGITERYEESINLFSAYSEINLETLQLNKAPSDSPEITQKELDVLLEANEQDISLYKKALAIFEDRLRDNKSSGNGSYRGNLSFINNSIQGWVINENDPECDEYFILFINDFFMKRFKPTNYRPDIKNLGLSRSGSCGFLFKSINLNSGDIVKIKRAHDNAEILKKVYE